MTGWHYSEYPVMKVSVGLACGHTIEASEHDGGMDELPSGPSMRLLERVVEGRATRHAITGCNRETDNE